ncbi:MAG: GTPase ObgE [Acidimicrobiia bacterium]|nr:GTPase ObgE [Acidimicrobiia bacterium]
MFLDEARIEVKAGNGGCGCLAFRREKFVPRGGPSGGDGGRGGHVYLESTLRHNTLIQFRYNRIFQAKRGEHGLGSKCHGKDGDDLSIPVPVGTVVYDEDTGELVHDFTEPNERVMVCQGGRGGRGNAQFATPVNRAPRRFEYGLAGEGRSLRLELKLLADVGLVGFPNAGKSTLISRISSARPKIGDYPFTTLEPNLGVVELDDFKSYVVADMPGLIEGAHLGHGLGLQFLRHIERTKVLVHLVDLSDLQRRDPAEDFRTVNRELHEFNPAILAKPTLLVGSKLDAMDDVLRLKKLESVASEHGLEFCTISAATGLGLRDLKYKIASMLLIAAGVKRANGSAATQPASSCGQRPG